MKPQLNRRFWNLTSLSLAIISLVSFGCSPPGKRTAERLANSTIGSLGCEQLQSRLFNHLDAIPLDQEPFPSPDLVQKELRNGLVRDFSAKHFHSNVTEADIEEFVSSYMNFYRLLTQELPQKIKVNSPQQTLSALVGLELGDRTSPEKMELQERWASLKPILMQAAERLERQCGESSIDSEAASDSSLPEQGTNPSTGRETPSPLLLELANKYSAPVYGSMKAFLVAYQSCETPLLAPMDSHSPAVKGIEVVGRHPNGNGNRREITSLTDVINTHYYIKDQTSPASDCAHLKDHPLIYDYGGKPSVTADLDSSLDFFRDAGTGGPELGTDCSGFVFTAYASAGLKLRSDQPLKAIQVMGVSAGMIKEPGRNELNCLQKVNAELNPGDLIASNGHVVLVESVGEDPFGIASIKKLSDCQLNSIRPENFHFVITQSSPSKGAIGINRMLASAYFPTYATMANGLKDHALSACYRRFGKIRTPTTTSMSIVRHRGTPECQSEEIHLDRQECLATCPAITPLND